MRRCSKCRQAKEARDFYRASGGRPRRSWCKACFRAATREYRARHPGVYRKALKRMRLRYRDDPDYRARCKRASRRWAREHPARRREYAQRTRARNRAPARG